MGAGRTEIMQAIFGNLSYESGSIFIDGKQAVIKNPMQAIEQGIGFITEDRKTEGLLLEESIEKNVSLTNLGRISGRGRVVISREKEKGLVTKAIEELHIRGKPGPVTAIRFDIDCNDVEECLGGEHFPAREHFASIHPDLMHACGHDVHTAIGIGAAKVLSVYKDQLCGKIKLIFQAAEEGARGGA